MATRRQMKAGRRGNHVRTAAGWLGSGMWWSWDVRLGRRGCKR
jgi:hypothetical protein